LKTSGSGRKRVLLVEKECWCWKMSTGVGRWQKQLFFSKTAGSCWKAGGIGMKQMLVSENEW